MQFFVTGHLIGLLESLGTQSITAIELKQLIGLLRLNEEEKQVHCTSYNWQFCWI